MSLIVGLYFRNNFDYKQIIFASDGRAIEYKITNNGRSSTRIKSENAEKIKKLTPEICIGYVGKRAELFEDVYKELKKKIQEMIKKNLESFANKLQKIILEIVNTKEHKKIEKQLKQFNQIINKFIVGGVINNKLFLVNLDSDDKYKPKIYKDFPSLPD